MPRRFLLLYPFFDAERRALPVLLAGSTHHSREHNCGGVWLRLHDRDDLPRSLHRPRS